MQKLSGLQAIRTTSPWPLRSHGGACTQAMRWQVGSGTVLTLRPLQPADGQLLASFFETALSPRSRRQRFHGAVGRLSAQRLAQLADADFVRNHAWVLTRQAEGGNEQAVAEARFHVDCLGVQAEFALAVADEWQGQGLGSRLLVWLTAQANALHLQSLQGDVQFGNAPMHALARSQGLCCEPAPDGETHFVATLALTPSSAEDMCLPARPLARALAMATDRLLAARLALALSFAR
jgi:GNAT superfamily N-acetyltransferase